MRTRASLQVDYLRAHFSEISSTCHPLWHPLGFVSCLVPSEECNYTTRVHYWPKFGRRYKDPNWPIHTHAYDLSSCILEGRVRDLQYQAERGGDYAVYSVSYSGEDSNLVLTDQRRSIKKLVDEVREVGDEYSIPVGTFHQTVVPIGESAITLVVLSNFGEASPLVLGTPKRKCYGYVRVKYSREAFWKNIGESILK